VSFPAGAVDTPTIVRFARQPLPAPPDDLQPILAFGLTAQDEQGMPVTTCLLPFLIIIRYLDGDVVEIVEVSLTIYYLHPSSGQWTALPTVVDTANNMAWAGTTHLTQFALFGNRTTTPRRVYLPLIVKNY
jgi:hypothetical protein